MLKKTITHTKAYLAHYFEHSAKVHLDIGIKLPPERANYSAERLRLSLWRIEPEHLARAFEPQQGEDPSPIKRPTSAELRLNLYVLIVACPSSQDTYTQALQDLSDVVAAFQQQRCFSHDDNNSDSHAFPLQDKSLQHLSYELQSLSAEQHSSLWQSFGSTALPYVVYKIRTIGIQNKASITEARIRSLADVKPPDSTSP